MTAPESIQRAMRASRMVALSGGASSSSSIGASPAMPRLRGPIVSTSSATRSRWLASLREPHGLALLPQNRTDRQRQAGAHQRIHGKLLRRAEPRTAIDAARLAPLRSP
jgi:hypothetical protein